LPTILYSPRNDVITILGRKMELPAADNYLIELARHGASAIAYLCPETGISDCANLPQTRF
jgi:hypothetical protein